VEILDVDPDTVHIRLVKSIESQNKMNLEPLIIIDGKTSDVKDIEVLNSTSIESISVLKGDSIIHIYGIEATDGVILIKTIK
jgi:TonB-dependent SusC/RagA subfamily outer membrane receptor